MTVLLAAMALLAAPSLAGDLPPTPQHGAATHLRVASCATSTCHDAALPVEGGIVLQNENTTWQTFDNTTVSEARPHIRPRAVKQRAGSTMAGREERFGDYVERLGDVLGHADRRAPPRGYCAGLLLRGERESVEPMAARVDPARVGAAHQSLHHFVAKAAWDDATLLAAVRAHALPAMLERGPVRAWLVDDTGLPKKGKLSVGVARQYCGQLGKRDNCQVAVTLSVANEAASLPVAYRLYLPEAWAADPARRAMAGVPEEVAFATKPAIALDQIRQALAAGVPPGVVATDAAYGNDPDFRDGVMWLGLPYVAGILGTTSLW